MKFEIDDDVINETTQCHRDFKCLESENHIYCAVKECVRDEIHFIECDYTDQCNYKMDYGPEFICTCPTRKAIFKKYQK